MKSQLTLNAHPATCICIEFDPTGKYFAVGSAGKKTIFNILEIIK